MTRRRFGALSGGALASVLFSGACSGLSGSAESNDGRLAARPKPGVKTSAATGPLGMDGRDAILHLPEKAASGPLPLALMLHGATQSAEWMLRRLGTLPDEAGVAVLAVNSRDTSWDAIRGGFGPDVTFLNRALERVFSTVPIDPARIAIGGFSDGASYAISLGLINGDLFPRIIAFSPGFVVDGAPHGKPKFFISHGRNDQILPIDQCSRQIVPELKRRGYEVTFREFDGGHQVRDDLAREALGWLAASR
jgi:phospholipase/carboxylesterase